MQKKLKDLLIVIVGNICLAFAVQAFIIPNAVLTGGVSGVALLLKPFIDIDISLLVIIINSLLYLVGCAVLGRKFAINTLVSYLTYPLAILFMEAYVDPIIVDPILAIIYGAVLVGVGIGLAVSTGASTGGMDIPPLIMNHYFHLEVSVGIMITDGLTIILGLYVYGIEKVLAGLLCTYITGIFVDKIIMLRYNKAKSIQIISTKNEEISKAINDELDRGTTVLPAYGGYTGDKRTVIMTVVPDREYPGVQQVIERIDKNAFIIVSDVKEVRGEGFTFPAENRKKC